MFRMDTHDEPEIPYQEPEDPAPGKLVQQVEIEAIKPDPFVRERSAFADSLSVDDP